MKRETVDLKVITRGNTEYGNIPVGGIFKYNGEYYVALNYDYDLEKYPAIALTGDTRGDLLVNLDDNEMVRRCSLE